MTQFLLSTHMAQGKAREPMTEEGMRALSERIEMLEDEMKSEGVFLMSARLSEPGDALVVRSSRGGILTTDGPFAETKEQLAGFYIIETDDRDAALTWAARVTELIQQPIEIRMFAGMR